MKFKMAIEIELDVSNAHTEKFEGHIDEFCKDIAEALTEACTNDGISAKYEGYSWLEEHEKGYSNGILYFGNGE